MEVLDLFSAAAGGWSLGMHRAGFTTVAACEVEDWRRALYAENNPHVRLYDDVRTLTADRLRADLGRLPTIVVGSPPCQDISSANTKGKGVEGARSGLYFEAIRVIGEVRARWFALENSANLRTRGADAVIAALEAIGYACWPLVVRAGDVGANHERPRCWLLGCDLAQVTDPDGFGRDEGWSWGWGGINLPISADPRDPAQDGRGQGLPGRRAEPVERLSEQARGDAADADRQLTNDRAEQSRPEGEGSDLSRDGSASGDSERPAGAGPLSGRLGGLGENADAVGERPQGQPRGDEQWEGEEPERPELPARREMGLCAPDCGDAVAGGPLWSLADLADHLRLDDGLSARLAGTRIALGDGKGQSAASLVVEAFGDAVIPQIPEAIGRAILRTEAALSAIYGSQAA